jgi:hypothetical protein
VFARIAGNARVVAWLAAQQLPGRAAAAALASLRGDANADASGFTGNAFEGAEASGSVLPPGAPSGKADGPPSALP